MSESTRREDPAMTRSNFERAPGDTYWTQPWVTQALVNALEKEGIYAPAVWEPACGRGDMVRVLRANDMNVVASDVDLTHYREGTATCLDFLEATRVPDVLESVPVGQRAIITNPPYHRVPGTKNYMTDMFVKHALGLDVGLVCMLLRAEWRCADSRTHFFEERHFDKGFHMDVVLTSRPRWDDWENVAVPEHGPRHNYAWYVWTLGAGRSTTRWEHKY